MPAGSAWSGATRQGGLRRFAVAISLLNVVGHTVLGFEQSWAQPFVALAAAYATELAIEALDARASGRRPRFAGGPRAGVDFLLSAHISGLAVSMLLYANARLGVVAFAAVVAIASKKLLRAPGAGAARHFFNPSNLGITLTLLLFPWVGIAPPYQFTEGLGDLGDWLLPAFIVGSGSFLNLRFTGRMPLILAWLCGFAAQAGLRTLLFGTPLQAALLPMTGMAFILYTFYMLTDPASTPSASGGQVAFGLSVAAAYGTLMLAHVVFGLFFALSIVSALRGALLHSEALLAERSLPRVRPQIAAPAGPPAS